MATQDELDRLSGILAGFPTTEAQDQKLLNGGTCQLDLMICAPDPGI
jgi:hypothetical protein